jgi:hypothetical protein
VQHREAPWSKRDQKTSPDKRACILRSCIYCARRRGFSTRWRRPEFMRTFDK